MTVTQNTTSTGTGNYWKGKYPIGSEWKTRSGDTARIKGHNGLYTWPVTCVVVSGDNLHEKFTCTSDGRSHYNPSSEGNFDLIERLDKSLNLTWKEEPPHTAPLGDETQSVTDTLTERGKRYGSFKGHATITQTLKLTMQNHGREDGQLAWDSLAADQAEALEMIVHKIGRILNGDPNYDDSWHDIAGYAQLVADRLRGIVR